MLCQPFPLQATQQNFSSRFCFCGPFLLVKRGPTKYPYLVLPALAGRQVGPGGPTIGPGGPTSKKNTLKKAFFLEITFREKQKREENYSLHFLTIALSSLVRWLLKKTSKKASGFSKTSKKASGIALGPFFLVFQKPSGFFFQFFFKPPHAGGQGQIVKKCDNNYVNDATDPSFVALAVAVVLADLEQFVCKASGNTSSYKC